MASYAITYGADELPDIFVKEFDAKYVTDTSGANSVVYEAS
jgi:hypothetical protein